MMINILRICLKNSIRKNHAKGVAESWDVEAAGEAVQTSNHSLTSGKKNQTKEQTTQNAQANSFY